VRGDVREANALIVCVENAGDFVVPREALRRVHAGKVRLDAGWPDEGLRRAMDHAHDRKKPGAQPGPIHP
jgi:hypothetical protein